MSKRILISGLPRSGTAYTTAVLQRLGLDVGHEVDGSDGIVSWRLLIPHNMIVRVDHVSATDSVQLHQVRHPVQCIASMGSMIAHRLRSLGRYLQLPDPDDSPTKSVSYRMALWLRWNLHVEQWAEHTYRVEALPEIWNEFCSWVGVEPVDSALLVPKQLNSRYGRYRSLTLKDLYEADPTLCDRIVAMAERYGYSL